MTCNCNEGRIELVMKQGTRQSFNLTIKTKEGNPVDLSSYTVQVDIKKYPLVKVDSLISFYVTQDSSENGQITDPMNGKVTVTITEDNSSLSPAIYYLIVQLTNPSNTIIISGNGDSTGILKICNQ
jgi:hypothetical protein